MSSNFLTRAISLPSATTLRLCCFPNMHNQDPVEDNHLFVDGGSNRHDNDEKQSIRSILEAIAVLNIFQEYSLIL